MLFLLQSGRAISVSVSELCSGRRTVEKAETLARRMPGAAALKVVADDETGELEGVTILGQWGEVPDDFAESLQG
ncbi:hypothetical protein [Methylobacterium sp. B1]|uniref:hypothetical protein n=1 Tax=Methylobacterium sp. B1 TaxID=91459 RepID=UPI0005BA7948|nr:hypothetical protein [Methylobacterium sp. B1]